MIDWILHSLGYVWLRPWECNPAGVLVFNGKPISAVQAIVKRSQIRAIDSKDDGPGRFGFIQECTARLNRKGDGFIFHWRGGLVFFREFE